MRPLAPIALMLLAVPAFAGSQTGKKLNLKPQQVESEDPGSATHLIYEAPKPEERAPDKSKVSTNVTCTDSVGMIYRKGEKGYDGCLRTMDLAKPTSNDSRQRPSLGITIGQ